jgi:hypothetical protein
MADVETEQPGPRDLVEQAGGAGEAVDDEKEPAPFQARLTR